MTNLIKKLSAALSNTVLFAAAIIMAGLGFAVVGTLALFALVAFGIALIAAPFVSEPKTTTATL
ncbi:MAG: hypothetical protein AAFN59_09510 [Pseudomonadota bacterium]